MVLKDLLANEKFHYLKILNNHPDLNRTVDTVESTEAPDVTNYIPRNTLLVMTGMIFRDDPARLCVLLEELDQCACAAVAIKLGRFIDTLDQSVIHTADQLGLPLLQIPMDKTLGNVYQEVLSHIWNNQNSYLLGALNAQQKISNLIRQGSSMKGVINNISMILGKPAMLVDLFGSILEYSFTYTRVDREKTIRILGKAMPGRAQDKSTYFLIREEGIQLCIFPIRGVGRNTNYIIISEFDPLDREENLLVMEQLVMALEMYFYKNLYVKYNEMRQREEFLLMLLENLGNKNWNERQLLASGSFYGLKNMPKYRIVLLTMGAAKQKKFNPVNFSKREERYILIYDWISHMASEESSILIFPQETQWRYFFLLQGKQTENPGLFCYIHDMIQEKFGFDVTIAQGGTVSSIMNLRNSLDEAERCLEEGRRDGELPYLLSYKPKGMKELFKFIPEWEVRNICRSTLKELAYPEHPTEEELRRTLYTYLFSGSSLTKTADILYVHRNTIKYRIKKCEELLKLDLSNASNCFQIQLALVLTEYAR